MDAVRKKNVAKIQTTFVQQQELVQLSTTRKRKLLLRRLTFFFVFVMFVAYFMVSSIFSQASELDGKLAQRQKLNKELSSLKKQQQILKEDIVKLNDDDYIAKLARKEYFFSNKDEIIFNIPDHKKGK